MKKILWTLLFGMTFAPALALAQALPDPVQFIIAPETPGPHAPVIIEVQGVGSFLGDATITWTLDGKVALAGPGERKFSFTTGALGVVSRVGVSIVSDTQGTIRRTYAFSPSLVNMIWEADTSVPPLSRAKPLYSAGSTLRVLAFPVVYNGPSRIAASSLSFQWSVNDNPVTSASGVGRNIFSLTGDQLQQSEDVSVDVFFGNTKVAQGEVVIPATTPLVAIYEHDALRGEITDVSIPQSITLSAKEITLEAEPLYFSNSSKKNNALQYTWTLNNETATGPLSDKGILTLRQTGSGSGGASIGVSIQNQNPDQLVQAASTIVQLVFGQQTSLLQNLFGI